MLSFPCSSVEVPSSSGGVTEIERLSFLQQIGCKIFHAPLDVVYQAQFSHRVQSTNFLVFILSRENIVLQFLSLAAHLNYTWSCLDFLCWLPVVRTNVLEPIVSCFSVRGRKYRGVEGGRESFKSVSASLNVVSVSPYGVICASAIVTAFTSRISQEDVFIRYLIRPEIALSDTVFCVALLSSTSCALIRTGDMRVGSGRRHEEPETAGGAGGGGRSRRRR